MNDGEADHFMGQDSPASSAAPLSTNSMASVDLFGASSNQSFQVGYGSASSDTFTSGNTDFSGSFLQNATTASTMEQPLHFTAPPTYAAPVASTTAGSASLPPFSTGMVTC